MDKKEEIKQAYYYTDIEPTTGRCAPPAPTASYAWCRRNSY